MDAVLGALLLFCTLLAQPAALFAQQSISKHADVNLYHVREAYINATGDERAALRQRIFEGIPVGEFTVQDGEEQLKAFQLCCSMWDVQEVQGAAGAVDVRDLPNVSIESVDSVGFMMGEGREGRTCDTVFFSTNRLAGYGGLDVYYSEWYYYPAQKIWVWQVPSNLGFDVNTGADEVAFRRTGSTFEFIRITDGVARRMIATPKTIISSVHVTTTCKTATNIIMNAYDCDGYFRTSIAFETGYEVDLMPNAKRLEFRCCGTREARTFYRCEITERSLDLEDIDVRTHVCEDEGLPRITAAPPPIMFGFSVYEETTSAESALRRVIKELEARITEKNVVHITRIPGHLEEPLNRFVADLNKHNVRVHEAKATGARTLIALR